MRTILRPLAGLTLASGLSSPSGDFYDKFGAYRTASGQGPATVVWSGVKFWTK